MHTYMYVCCTPAGQGRARARCAAGGSGPPAERGVLAGLLRGARRAAAERRPRRRRHAHVAPDGLLDAKPLRSRRLRRVRGRAWRYSAATALAASSVAVHRADAAARGAMRASGGDDRRSADRERSAIRGCGSGLGSGLCAGDSEKKERDCCTHRVRTIESQARIAVGLRYHIDVARLHTARVSAMAGSGREAPRACDDPPRTWSISPSQIQSKGLVTHCSWAPT